MPVTGILVALQVAIEGVSYQSESDEPWQAFHWKTADGELNIPDVLKRGRHKPDTPVVEQSAEDFFAPLTEDQDWYEDAERAVAAKYRQLAETVQAQLPNAKVFRVGERRVAIYVVGVAKEGGWAGVKTLAVET